MTLAAAHATLQALVAPARPRVGAPTPRSRGPASSARDPRSDLSRGSGSSARARRSHAAARGVSPRARASFASSENGATDIIIPDAFTPPSRQIRGGEKPYFPPVGVADDPTLANPLQRQKMLSTEWFGCVFELEGVLVKARDREHRASWMRLAKERDESPIAEMNLRFASSMKPEDFVSRQLRWTRDPMEMRRINRRRAEIFDEILAEQDAEASTRGETPPPRDELLPGVLPFLRLLRENRVPMAATCGTKTFADACASLEGLGILRFFENELNPSGEPNVVSGEDVSDWLPDPLPIERAARLMNRTTKRCVVFGDSNAVAEASTECGAKSVLLLGRQPRYELQAADAVIKSLSDLNVSNLKNLFAAETSEAAEPERQVEIFPAKRSQTLLAEDWREAERETQSDAAGGKGPPSYRNRRKRRDV
jgi:beta-phosphoglucomutase-like phosphatase (HAD superfamily)